MLSTLFPRVVKTLCSTSCAGTTIVHVMTDEAREEYNLEGLWAQHGGIRRIETRQQVQTLSTMRV